MADVLDHLQMQEELLNRLHIQAARQLLIRGGKASASVNAVATIFLSNASKQYPVSEPARNASGYWKSGKNTT